jgi:hypothetical protein
MMLSINQQSLSLTLCLMFNLLGLHLLSTEVSASPAYPLDELSREVPAKGKVRCPKVKLTRYKGEHVTYHKRLLLSPHFIERLKPFELLVNEVAKEVYGRAPHRVFHLGSYNCRRIGGYPTYISEHGMGNALDVAGFDFARLPKGEMLPESVPKALKRPFKVRMLSHWSAKGKGGVRALHERFLQTLAKRMIERKLFRVILGPSYPGHKNHLHIDQAPYELVEVF